MAALRTRLLKAICGECAYTVRVTRKWLEYGGPPLCPMGHGALEVPDADAWDCEDWEHRQRMAACGTMDRGNVLRDRFVYTRTLHDCAHCREEIQAGDYARHQVYAVGRELFNEYRHFNCAGMDTFGR